MHKHKTIFIKTAFYLLGVKETWGTVEVFYLYRLKTKHGNDKGVKEMLIDDKQLLRLNMQYFAETIDGQDDGKQNETPPADPAGEPTGDPKESKTFTQEEVDKMMSERWAREERKRQQEQADIVANAIKEGKRLAQLTAEEQAAEETKLKKAELDKREKEVSLKELKLDTQARLTAENLPLDFTDFLIGDDGESTNSNIKKFKAVFDKAVSEAVTNKLKESTISHKSSYGAINATNKGFDIKDFQNKNRLIK